MAQVLLRRLAAEKQQATVSVKATATAPAEGAESPVAPGAGEKAAEHDDRDADRDCTSLTARRLGRFPWRAGGASGTFLTEKRRAGGGGLGGSVSGA